METPKQYAVRKHEQLCGDYFETLRAIILDAQNLNHYEAPRFYAEAIIELNGLCEWSQP